MILSVQDMSQDLYADPQARVEFKRLMTEQGAVQGFEYQLRRKDGARVWISENARVVRGSIGEVVAYEGTMEDITERKRAELERQVTFEIIHASTSPIIWTICST